MRTKMIYRYITVFFAAMLFFVSFSAFAEDESAQLFEDEIVDLLEITEDTYLENIEASTRYSAVNVDENATLTLGRGTYIIGELTGDGRIVCDDGANLLVDGENKPCGYVEIALDDLLCSSNVRYFEINGNQYKINENNNRFGTITQKNLLIEITEKSCEDSGRTEKIVYYYVDAESGKSEQLSLKIMDDDMYGISLRANKPVGIRYMSSIRNDSKDAEQYAYLTEFGYIFALEDQLLEQRVQLNFDFYNTVSGIAYSREEGVNKVFDSRNELLSVFSGAIVNLPDYAYGKSITSKTYSVINVFGQEFTVYGEPVTTSAYETAMAVSGAELTSEQSKNVEYIISKAEENIKVLDSGMCGDSLEWELLSDGTLHIFGTGEMYDYVKYTKPSPWYKYRYEPYISKDGLRILGNDGKAYLPSKGYFEDNPDGYIIKRIQIDEGVTYIGNWAFYRVCVDELVIPEGVEKTGHFCVRFSPTIKRLILPDSLKILGDYGVSRNIVLETIEFGEGLEHIGFAGCQNNPKLTAAILPAGIKTLGEQQNPAYVGSDAGYKNVGVFENCVSLRDITFGSVKSVPQRTCMRTAVESIVIPASATEIGEYAFYGCERLKEVKFERTSECKLIANQAFSECVSLESVTGAVALETVMNGAFTKTKNLKTFEFSDSNISFANAMFIQSNIRECSIGPNVKTVPNAFLMYSTVEKIHIALGVSEFCAGSFHSCTKLTDIYYDGTRADWDSITKASGWAGGGTAEGCTVHFKDGKTESLKNCIA